jgi:hypothetical protein
MRILAPWSLWGDWQKVIAMGAETSKIKLKLGDFEFEYEGDADEGKNALAAFLGAASAARANASSPAPPPAPNAVADVVKQPDGNGSPPPPQSDGMPLKRVFAEKDAVISLLALPKTANTDGDALLLLLYGYQELKSSEYPVTGVRLMQAAKQSGLQLGRIDRTMLSNEQFVLSAGAKRGKRYHLNNLGIAKAKEIINAIFG